MDFDTHISPQELRKVLKEHKYLFAYITGNVLSPVLYIYGKIIY